MHLTRYTASHVSLFHTFPLTQSLIHNMSCCVLDDRIYVCATRRTGAPLSVYSILFTYYDPGTTDNGFASVYVAGRSDILMMYMRSGKPLHTRDLGLTLYYYGYSDIFYYAIENGMWTGSLDEVFVTTCKYGHTDYVTQLLPHIDVHQQDDRGLFESCRFSREDMVRLLLARDTYPRKTLAKCIRSTANSSIRTMLQQCYIHIP